MENVERSQLQKQIVFAVEPGHAFPLTNQHPLTVTIKTWVELIVWIKISPIIASVNKKNK